MHNRQVDSLVIQMTKWNLMKSTITHLMDFYVSGEPV